MLSQVATHPCRHAPSYILMPNADMVLRTHKGLQPVSRLHAAQGDLGHQQALQQAARCHVALPSLSMQHRTLNLARSSSMRSCRRSSCGLCNGNPATSSSIAAMLLPALAGKAVGAAACWRRQTCAASTLL